MSAKLSAGQSVNLSTGQIDDDAADRMIRNGVRRNDIEALFMLLFPETPEERESWAQTIKEAS